MYDFTGRERGVDLNQEPGVVASYISISEFSTALQRSNIMRVTEVMRTSFATVKPNALL